MGARGGLGGKTLVADLQNNLEGGEKRAIGCTGGQTKFKDCHLLPTVETKRTGEETNIRD